MAFKFIILSVLLVAVNAGYLTPLATHVANPAHDAVATTQQNVVRSFDGTVSQYSKSVHTPYSSVHKEDTRINNNVYSPATVQTVTKVAPAVAKTVAYSPTTTALPAISVPAVTKAVFDHQQPIQVAAFAPYAYHKIDTQEQPAHSGYVATTPTAAAFVPQHEAPSDANPIHSYGPAASTYSHNSPAISAYGTRQTIHYSPAEMVSHMHFEGFGTQWGF